MVLRRKEPLTASPGRSRRNPYGLCTRRELGQVLQQPHREKLARVAVLGQRPAMYLLYEGRNLQGNAIFATEIPSQAGILAGRRQAEVLAVLTLEDAQHGAAEGAAARAASDQQAVQHVEVYASSGSEGENLRARRHVDEEQQVEAELDRVAGALFRAIVEDSVRSRYGWA